MAVRTIAQGLPINGARLLRNALRIDGIFTGLAGVILAGAASWLAPMLGAPATFLVVDGLMLVAYAGVLFTIAARKPISRRAGLIIGMLNLAFALCSVIALVEGMLSLTPTGLWLVAIVAFEDAIFGELQLLGAWRMK